ncbi:PHP domain-containing protein [Phytohabitans flavus]|uniref:PHP domain-containing protein n=1 Tax=Phytohabitans flavus TaxID=1076124 RepID=UPI001E2E9C9A|nr:PHP domain-containing protein [Phytohabitans flavus]
MLPADNHVHSEWSFDTGPQASMVGACARAVEVGVPAIAFTEHLEFTDWVEGDAIAVDGLAIGWWALIRPIDLTGYLACVAECRERFPGLRIRTGVEAGEPHMFGASVAGVLASGPIERVLGSLHAIPHEGRLIAPDKLFHTLGTSEVMRRYFTEMVRMIKESDVFEVLAHLDYPRRYWPADAPPYREADYEEGYRAVLRALAGSDRVLEINTRSPLASVDLLRWWREEGGRAVSFGSDAHVPWIVGDKFDLAVDVAASAGFTHGRDPYDFWRR